MIMSCRAGLARDPLSGGRAPRDGAGLAGVPAAAGGWVIPASATAMAAPAASATEPATTRASG